MALEFHINKLKKIFVMDWYETIDIWIDGKIIQFGKHLQSQEYTLDSGIFTIYNVTDVYWTTMQIQQITLQDSDNVGLLKLSNYPRSMFTENRAKLLSVELVTMA